MLQNSYVSLLRYSVRREEVPSSRKLGVKILKAFNSKAMAIQRSDAIVSTCHKVSRLANTAQGPTTWP